MKAIFIVLLSLLPLLGLAQGSQHQLSTHILNISTGAPAPGVTVRLEKFDSAKKAWTTIDEKKTDAAGRIGNFLPAVGNPGNTGIYKLTFLTQPYFEAQKQASFYPYIDVVFEIKDGAHYHVPITLSPFGYSTYRGS
ncbi:hydroxyisourate hydrolase [Hymenobacter sp. CRA2]|uniref:hydroxyisourate hydrolase n=1 Tax=Hymenobacter sp. CRA2 TaxID=1955620 RepID=UPI00098FF9FA|nr:hydroxyisourate hydrolase [Hymenobacter sp. CRA2]OON67864.1 hydroxyisourate hydrolase [Hymenobacter sp. CRA2]